MQSRRQRLHCKLWLVAQIPGAVAVAEQQIEAGVARCDGWQRFAVCACAERAAQISGYQPTARRRSEEHTSELQSLMRISYAVVCLKKKTRTPSHMLHAALIQTDTHTQHHVNRA